MDQQSQKLGNLSGNGRSYIVSNTRYIMYPPFLIPKRMERMRILYEMIKEPEILHRKRPRAVWLANQRDAPPSALCVHLLDLEG